MRGWLCSATVCVAIGWAGAAAAESCVDRVVEIGARYGLATDPPTVGRRSPDFTVRDLARSGGVVEPRPLADGTVVGPPPGKNYGMPTLPDVSTKDLPGTDLTALQAILVAARAQAERGNEHGCWAALGKVTTIVDRH